MAPGPVPEKKPLGEPRKREVLTRKLRAGGSRSLEPTRCGPPPLLVPSFWR